MKKVDASIKKPHHHQTAEAAEAAPEAKNKKQKQNNQGEKRKFQKGRREEKRRERTATYGDPWCEENNTQCNNTSQSGSYKPNEPSQQQNRAARTKHEKDGEK